MSSLTDLERQSQDSKLSLTGMASQLGINIGISFGVLMVFNVLRPNNSLVYAPKYKYATKSQKPPAIKRGMFAWIRPVMKASDEELLDQIGFDAILFIRFMRMLRNLLYAMSFVGICVLIPINVAATSYTGFWGVELLSISTINYYDGKFHSEGNLSWYWAHTVGTWLFSLLIYRTIFYNYRAHVLFRKSYFETKDYQQATHARTLMILNVPAAMQSDTALGNWITSMDLPFPFLHASIGRHDSQLTKSVEEHEKAVRKLELLLSNHLLQGNKKNLTLITRPMMRTKWFGRGQKVDAIEYYSSRIQTLRQAITQLRSDTASDKRTTNYGWIVFSKPFMAHAVAQRLSAPSSPLLSLPRRLVQGAKPRVELAPPAKDLVWSNLAMNEHIRDSRRVVGSIVFYVFTFLWFIPSSFLSASSNVKNFIRLFPDADLFIQNHSTFVSLMSSWFSPVVMAIFFLILPKILRLLSQQQGYLTETSLDRQVLSKLYVFFMVNNLFVFTVSSVLLAMYAQIQLAAKDNRALTAQEFFETMGNVSTFWVNYVSLKGLGVVMDLAQIFGLISVTLRKLFTKPSPRQLREMTVPIGFDYPLYYNILLFFFTVGLMYSVIAPLVLPFTMFYFMLATMVFRYLLMYVYVTPVETGGQIWRVLINRLLISTVMYQLVMIGVLNLKGAVGQSSALIPLPFFTVLLKLYCRRYFDPHVYYQDPNDKSNFNQNLNHNRSQHKKKETNSNRHGFRDPALFAELPIPMVHERVRHLLPHLYR
ncbi:hypothetical protein PHYBLDRAFT_113255, partial [Phycomyces blakesleeanus NRRL 1555(-)]